VPRISGAADVAEYRLSVYHTGEASDPPIRSIRGGDLPDQLIWDGFSNAGDRVADGSYDLVLTVQFRNGTREESAVRSIRVDTTPPRAEIEAPYRLFSPNGDGRRDRLPIRQEGSTQELWEGRIIGGSGEVLKSWYWKGRPGNFEWDGTDAAGNPLDDGRYRYRLFARDAAGNSSSREISEIRIDTRRPELFVAVTRREISPNGDDYLDDTLIRSFASVRTGIESRRLELRRTAGEGGAQAAEEGSTLRVFTGTDLSSPHETTWNGRDDAGEVVHGTVTPHLEVRYTKGDLVTAEGPGIRVDARPPTTEVEASPLPFSPDGDGTADLLRIDLAASDTGEIAGWEFRILNPSDELFRRFQGRGAPPGSLEWNGRSIDGERVISAETYRYQFEVTDDLGNVAVREGNILIDILQVRENGRLTVEIAPVTFPRGSTELITDPFTERGARNAAVIERFAAMLRQFPDYRVVVEGHAVNESGSRQEEVDEAEPRSQERAEAVRRALIDAGIDADRLSALGRGSSMPIVPDSNIDERRRNRRVEFLLRR
jgi:outer membrane protein OmpA-like peptidoglycan-associated protein